MTIATEFIGVSLALGYFGVSQYVAVPIAAVALVSTGLTMIASTLLAMKFCTWLICLETSSLASSICSDRPGTVLA